LAQYQPIPIAPEMAKALRQVATKAAQKFGMDELPPLPED
jgi:hypothetical protein